MRDPKTRAAQNEFQYYVRVFTGDPGKRVLFPTPPNIQRLDYPAPVIQPADNMSDSEGNGPPNGPPNEPPEMTDEMLERARALAEKMRADFAKPEYRADMEAYQRTVLAFGAPLFRDLVCATLGPEHADLIAEIQRRFDIPEIAGLVFSPKGKPPLRLSITTIDAAEDFRPTNDRLVQIIAESTTEGDAQTIASRHVSSLLTEFVRNYGIAAAQFDELTQRINEALGLDAAQLRIDPERISFYLREECSRRIALRLMPMTGERS